MTTNYARYVFYSIAIITCYYAYFSLIHFVKVYKDNIIKATISEIKLQQNEITIKQQDNIVKQQAVVFKKSQQIIKDSVKIEKEISSAITIPEKVAIKYSIIDEMNCRVTNFTEDSLCTK